MVRFPIYTIGHGTLASEDLLQRLEKFNIQYLIDVRSQPHSKFNPQHNQSALKFFMERAGIKYVFMGDTLGGRPKDPSCYNSKGKVDYELVKRKVFFRSGITRLKTAYDKNLKIAIMCSEGKPGCCHRTKLIGEVLQDENIPVLHINENGGLIDQFGAMNG